MSKTLRGRRWTGWSARKPSILRPFPLLRVEELEQRAVPASFTWSGTGGNANWTNAGNWQGGIAPTGVAANLDSLTFPAGVSLAAHTSNNDINNGTFYSISISDNNYTITGRALTLGSATASGSITSSSKNDVIALDIGLGGAAGSKQFFTVGGGAELTISGRISGNTGSIFTKDGIGLLVLSNDNSNYIGPIAIDNGGGILRIANSKALGDALGETTVGTNATLEVSNVAGNINEPLRLNGPGVSNLGALRSFAGANTWTGKVILDSNATFGAVVGTSINITGVISDTGAGRNVTKEDFGEVRFSGSNTYRGMTTINNGTLTAANSNALGTANRLVGTGTVVNETNSKAGRLQIAGPAGSGFTILNENLIINGDGLVGIGGLGLGAIYNSTGDNNWAGPVQLGSAATSVTYAAMGAADNTDLIVSGIVTGGAGFLLEKVEPGRVILNNVNTYSGNSRVFEGILNIRDSKALGTGNVDVIDGGTLELEVEAATTTPRYGYDQSTGTSTGRDLWADSVTADPNQLVLNNQIQIDGRGFQNTGALRSRSGINTVLVDVTLNGPSNAAIGVDQDQRPGHPTPTSSYFINDYSLTILGSIAGGSTTDFVKRGAGHLILPGANSYTGVTQIEQGWVTIENNDALGVRIPGLGDTVQPEVYVLTGASLHLRAPNPGSPLTINKNLTIGGSGPSHPYSFISAKGALVNIGGDNTWAGDIELLAAAGIGVEAPFAGLPSELSVTGSTLDSINTQTFFGDGGTREQVYWIDTGTTGTTYSINWNFTPPPSPPEPIADRLTVYYAPRYSGATATQIFNTGYITGVSSTNLTFGPGTSTIAEFVMNENPPGGTGGSAFTITIASPTVPGGIIKYGSQRLRLQGDGTFTGEVRVNEGTLRAEHDTALGHKSSGTLTAQQTYSQTNTIVASGAVLETAKGITTNNGGIAAGIEIFDERLVLNASAYQVAVAGDPLTATFQLHYVGPTGSMFDTQPLSVASTALDVQTALFGVPITTDGETATVTKTGNVFSIVFGNAIAKDVMLTATVAGGAEATVFDGQSSLIGVDSDNVWRGPTTLALGSRARVGDQSRLTLLGAIDDDPTGNPTGSQFAKRGLGELMLGGLNSYRGTTIIDQGIVTAMSSQAFGFGDSTAITGTIVSPGAQLQIQGNLTIASEALTIAGSGPVLGSVPDAVPVRWLEIGGGPINNGQNPGLLPVTGRVTGTAVDPTDPNVIYISTAGGGAWKTKDGGHTWLPLFDLGSATAPLRGGAIAVNPKDPTNIFYGTGEINNADGNNNTAADTYAGTGVYESSDSGRTWTLLRGPGASNPLYGQSVSKIVVQPPFSLPDGTLLPLTIYVGTSDFQVNASSAGAAGVWRYNGTSWFNLTGSTSPYRATRIGGVPFDVKPPNTPGPDDDYRVEFPQTDVTWTDLALVYYDPDVVNPGATLSVPVLYAALMERGGGWSPGFPANFEYGGYNSGVFRTENPFSNQPIWYLGDSGATASAPVPVPDNRAGNGFQAGPFNSAGFPDLGQLPRNGRTQLTAQSGGIWTNTAVWASTAFPISGIGSANDGRFRFMQTAPDSGKAWGLLAITVTMQNYMGVANLGRGWYDSTMISSDANTLYVGGAGGSHVWQSLDAGSTWNDLMAFPNGPSDNDHAFAIIGTGPTAQIVVGGDGGVWRFNPVGNTWNDINGTLAITNYNGIAVSPFDFNTAYGGSQGNGTAKFTGGLAWNRTDANNGGLVQVDSTNPNNVYHVTNGALRKSTDAGATWNTIRNANSLYFPFALDPINPQRLLTSDGGTGVYESLDGGASWNPLNYVPFPLFSGSPVSIALAQFQGPFVADTNFPLVGDIGSNTYDSNTVYVTDASTVFVTKNSGLSWQDRGPQVTDDLYDLTFGTGALKYKNIGQITLTSTSPGVYLTARTLRDGDRTGSFTTTGNLKDEIQTVEVVYPTGTVGTFNLSFTIPFLGNPFNTPARNVNLTNIAIGTSGPALAGLINAAIAPYNGNEVQLLEFSNIAAAPTYTLSDGVNTTAAIVHPATAADINAALAAATPGPIAGTASIVGGRTFITFPGNTPVPLLVAAGTNMEVYVKEVQQGGAGSVTSNLGAGTGPSWTHVTVDGGDRNAVYTTAQYVQHQNGPTVFRSLDAGQTWSNISGAGLPNSQIGTAQPAWTLVVDPRDGKLYVGTDVGVYASVNDGINWFKFGAGMPNVQVKDLVMNQTLNTLSAGTYGRSMYQLFLDYAKADSGAIRAVSGNSFWTGPVTLNDNTQFEVDGTQNVQNGIANASLNIIGVISGNFDITKTGQGTLVFSGANTYGGQTFVNEGILQVNNPNALGSPLANTIVSDGAALELATDLYLEPITINGDGYMFNDHLTGALRNVSGFNTYTGPLTMNGKNGVANSNNTIGTNSGTQLTIGGVPGNPGLGTGSISDGLSSFSLTKELTGTLVLASANAYDGLTNIVQGALRVEDALALGTSGQGTRVFDGAQLQISRNNVSLLETTVVSEPLFLSGTGIFGTGAIQNIRGDLGAGSNNNTWQGSILLTEIPNFSPATISTPLVALGSTDVRDTLTLDTVLVQNPVTPGPVAYALNKVGPGRVTLTKDNAYTGLTSVNGGNLRIQRNNALGPQDSSQMQLITLSNLSGSYKLSFGSQTTAGPNIPASASAATVQAALEALSSIGVGNVFVAETPKGAGKVLTILFRGVFEPTPVGPITAPVQAGVAVTISVATAGLSITATNNAGAGYAALDFTQSGGFVPPDTSGAVGPTSFVETVNQAVGLYPNKATGAGAIVDSLDNFYFNVGGLPRADGGSSLSDPIVTYDEHIGRFIVGDQDVNFVTHVSNFVIAVSKTSSPATLTAADWNFYFISTTQNFGTGASDDFDADYPGNFGYNADAFTFTLNMFPAGAGAFHVLVTTVDASDLAAGVSQGALRTYQNDFIGASLRPTVQHDALPGDPLWFVQEGGSNSIDMVKMTNVLSNAATFGTTILSVNAYSSAVNPLNPDGSVITNKMDSRIINAAEANNTIVAAHSVSVSGTEDAAQWYIIDVSSGTPVLSQQGRVTGGNNTYTYYPAIDINPSGQIGMTFMRSGTDTATNYMSMYVTGRISSDASGTMQAPIIVPAGAGQANYSDFSPGGRAGDLSGISIDPVDGTFWAVDEYATGAASNNWGTAVANFTLATPLPLGTVVNSGSLELDATLTGGLLVAEALTLNGDGVANAGALNNVSGNNIYSGPITLASDASIGAVTSTQLTIQGLLQDQAPVSVPAARFRKAGEGTVVLPNTKTYGGVTVVDDGILNIRTPDALGEARNEEQIVQVVATSGTFRLSFRGQTTAPLQFNATALQVETELNAISTIGAPVGGFVIVGLSSGAGINTYTITFGGTLQNAQVPQIQAIYVAPSAITTVQQGSASLGEIQTVRVTASGGAFGLTFNGFTTTAIAVNASAATVENALNAIASIAPTGSVTVFISGPLNDRTYTVVFGGSLATGNLQQMTSAVVGGTLVTTDTNLDGQGGTTVNSGGTLQLEGSMNFDFPMFGEIITLNGQGYNNIGALNVLNGNVNWIAPLPLLLGSNASIGVSNAGDTLTMLGPISDGGGRFDLDFYGPGTVHYRGDGNGSYNGTNYTIYTGTTTVHSGTMLLDVTGSIDAIRGPLVVGDGVGGPLTARVILLQSDEIADTQSVTVNSDGLLDLNAFSETIGNLTVNGGLVITQPNGSLTTGTIGMTGGVINVGDNASLTGGNTTMTSGALIQGGINSTISLGDLSMDASTIAFLPPGPATFIVGNITMTNGSQIILPQGDLTSLDIYLDGGSVMPYSTISLGDDSNLTARNVTVLNNGNIALGKRDTFTATGAVSVSSSGIIQLDEDGLFAITGNLTMADGTVKLADATVANKAKLTTAEVSMTGASLIQIGNNGFLIASGKVTDMGGDIILGNTGLFTAGGNVSLTDGSVLFGTDGLFNNQPNDLSLVNSQFTMGDNGTAKTKNVSLANSSDLTFGNVGVLDAAAGNLTMTGGSDLTFLNTGTATTKNINIVGGTISFQDTGILAAANVTDNGGAISFGNTGLFTAGTVAVSGNGSIGFGTLAFPLDPYVTGGLNGKFTATGAVSFNDADFWMGDFGTATVQSLSLTTGSQVTFNDNGTLNDAGLLNLSGNSKLIFGDTGNAKAGDASQSNGLIAFLDSGTFEVTNFTNNGGAVSFKNLGIFKISPASLPVTVTNGSITFGNDGQFLDSGSLRLVQSSLILGNTGKVSTLAVTTSGASKIQMGNDGTIDTASVTVATGGTIVLGNNNKFTALGNVSATGSNSPLGVIFGTDGVFKITGSVSLSNSELKLGTTGTVQVLGPTGDVTLSNAAKLTLAANGILTATGDLTMSGNSTADFGANGSASVNDLSISTGTFKMAAGTSPALHGLSASGTGLISGAAVTLGNNNHFAVVGDTKIEVSGANPASLTLGTGSTLGTGKLTVTSANVTVGANSTGTTLDMIVTGSSSKITFGDNDTLNTKNLTSTSGTFAFGINNKLLADGNVSFTNGAVNFSTAALGGAGGKLAATGDLTLDNVPLTFNVTGGIVTADDVFINNKSKITFANNGSLTAASTLNLDNGQMKFNTTGALTAGATTFRNSSIAGGSNITVMLGSLDSVTGSGAASSPAISLGSTSSLTVSGNVSLTNAIASTGGIILGNGNSFSAANVTLNTALLSLGNSGSFTTTGNLDLTVSQVQLGTSGSGSTQSISLLSSSIGIGAATTLAVNGNITADSTFLGTSSIAGLGAINLGSLPHSAIIGNGDSVDNVDLAITTGINATAGALLNKTGAGRLQLASPTPSVLGLNISAGDVQVDGVQTGPVQITSGTLSGKGAVGAITGSSGGPVVGTVAPGDNSLAIKSGILGSGSTVFGPQTVFSVDLSSSVPNNPIPGTDYDRLAVNGNLDLGNAVLDAHYGTGIRVGDSYTIITYTGTLTGKFQQFNSQDIAFVTGQKFTIDYSVAGSVILHKVRADATITMTSVPLTSTFNQTVTFTATISPELGSSLIPNTTTVTFFIDGNPTPTVTVGATNQAVYTISTMSVGTHILTATYNGDADNFNPANTTTSLTQTVEQPTVDPLAGIPSTTPAYISPINASSVGVQDQLSLSTTVRSERGTITWAIAIKNSGGGTVRTLIGNGNPGSGTTIPINAVWNGRDTGGTAVADGNYTATVTVTDSFTNVFSAAPIPVVVDNTSPTATINSPSPNVIDPTAASTLPASTLLTGTVGDLNLSSWVLDIRNGSTLLREFSGTGTAVNVNWNGLYDPADATDPINPTTVAPDAAYTITITSFDLAGNQTTSSTQTVVVLANGPIITLTTGAPNVYGTTFTLTATADLPAGSPASLYSLLAGDAVNFFQGVTPLGTGNLVLNGSTGKYQTSITGPILNAGTYTNFKAVYPATSDFPVGNSALASHTVTKAPLTITAIDKTRLYGAANPPFTFTTTGLVNNDTVAVLTGTLATTATSASNVGSYPITQGSLSPNGNYTITTFNNGTLSITPAPLTIRVNDATRPLNTPNPTFTFTVLGLVNGDLPSVVTSVPLGTTAVLNSPVGSYPITSTGTPTVSPNYTIVSIVPGSLSITPRLTSFSIGSGAGGIALVSLYNQDGSLIKTLTPFGSFFGGVRTAAADFNGDGVNDLAVGTGPGVVAQVSVFDGVSGANLFTSFPFETPGVPSFTGGLFVAAGDVDGDGVSELVITPDEGGGPRVIVQHGRTFLPMLSYLGINDPNFRGGARAGVGDLNGDGFADIAVSAGFDGGPRVSLWDGRSLANNQFRNLVSDFYVFSDSLRNGAYVAIGDVNGDGKGDLIAGAGPGGAPHVKIFSGASLLNPNIGPARTQPFASFFAGDEANRGGVRVAAKVLDSDLFVDVITGVGEKGGDTATAYLGVNLKDAHYIDHFTLDAFPGLNNNGVFVG